MKESMSDDYSITLLFEDYGTPVHITAMMVQEYLYTPNDGDAVGDFRVEKINPLESTIRFMRSKSEDIEFITPHYRNHGDIFRSCAVQIFNEFNGSVNIVKFDSKLLVSLLGSIKDMIEYGEESDYLVDSNGMTGLSIMTECHPNYGDTAVNDALFEEYGGALNQEQFDVILSKAKERSINVFGKLDKNSLLIEFSGLIDMLEKIASLAQPTVTKDRSEPSI